MRIQVIQRILGILLQVFSFTLVPPIIIATYTNDGALPAFAAALALTLAIGTALYMPVRNRREELKLRDGFVVVVLFWSVLGISGAIPFVLADHPTMSWPDAIFESISGLTTTGATVITGIDHLPASILYYRQQLQWLGGMGIIVLAVAILPMLGIGGMQLYRAETPGPMKDNKLTPRITETAKALWIIYLSMTIVCASAYYWAGMSLFDAVGHAFSTIAIGGFSTHDLSMGYFDNPIIETIAVVGMLFAGMNFSLHFVAWRSRSARSYLADPEVRAYVFILCCVCAITVTALLIADHFTDPGHAIRHGIFQAISIGTTTGFTTTEFQAWPMSLAIMLLFTSFIGCCAGSTGGGIKVIRALLLLKQGLREIHRLIHPSAQIPIKIGEKVLSDRVVDAIWGFFATYVAVFVIFMLLLLATGLDQVTAFSAVAACINNLGPGFGDVTTHYGTLSGTAKLILSLAMLMGRLEIFTLLVLLSPSFWRA